MRRQNRRGNTFLRGRKGTTSKPAYDEYMLMQKKKGTTTLVVRRGQLDRGRQKKSRKLTFPGDKKKKSKKSARTV